MMGVGPGGWGGVYNGTSTTSALPRASILSHLRARGSCWWYFFTRFVRSCSEDFGTLILEPPFCCGRSSGASKDCSDCSAFFINMHYLEAILLLMTHRDTYRTAAFTPLQLGSNGLRLTAVEPAC